MSLFKSKKTTSEEVDAAVTAEPKKQRKKVNFKNNRKLRIGTTATAVTVAVVAVIVLFNVVVGILNDRYPLSMDLTSDKSFTLSEESHAVAEKVTKEVTITMFADKSLFENPDTGYSETDTLFRQFYEFTNDYNSLTGGLVTTEYIDLDANPTLESVYSEYNVTAGSILFRCGDQWRTITLNDLYQEEYGDDYYYTYETTIYSLVEQKLATNINAVCGGKTVALTFLTGHGENQTYVSTLQELYEMNGYVIETTDFATATEISPDTGALVIVAPSEDYSTEEITRLRAWLKNDGNRERDLFVYCNYAAKCPNLYEFLEVDYGITVTDNLIWETDENNIPMSYYGSYPYSPLTTVSSTDLTKEVNTSDTVIMPLTLQLLTAEGTDTTESYLTNHSVVTFPETAMLVTTEAMQAEDATVDSIVKTEAESYPVIGMAYAYDYEYNDDNEQVGNYVFVSGSYRILDYITTAQYANEELVLSPMRAACSLGDTTAISAKSLTAETLSFDALTANILGLGVLTVGVPVILVILALVVFIRRRHL